MKQYATILFILIGTVVLSCNNRKNVREPVVTKVGDHAPAEGNDGLVDVGVNSTNPALSKAAKLVVDRRFDEAITMYQSLCATEKGDQLAIAYWGLGAAYSSAGQEDKAVDNYLKSMAIDSNNSGVYLNLATSYSNLKDYEKSVAYYKAAVEKDGKCTEAYWGLAVAYDRMGNNQLAKENARKYIGLEPNSKYSRLLEPLLDK